MQRTVRWVVLFSMMLVSGCAAGPRSPTSIRYADLLQPDNCGIPDTLKVNVSVTGTVIDLKIDNKTNEVWRLDWNACSVSQDPSGWQSKLVDGETTYANKNDVKRPLVVSLGFLETQMYPADLFVWNRIVGTYFQPWPIPDGGGFRVTLGFRDTNDKLHFCILTGNLSTRVAQ